MSTIVVLSNGTITTQSQLDDYEKEWIRQLAEKTDGNINKEQVENFLLKRDHIIIGGE